MFFSNLIQKATDKAAERAEIERKRRQAQISYMQEYQKQMHCQLSLTSGGNFISCPPGLCMMSQRQDGSVYFGTNTNRNYRLISYNWSGPLFDTTTLSNTNGQEITNGKAGKIGVGAVVGTMIAPGVGTAVGAAMGAGSKGKKSHSASTITNVKQIENKTPATLKMRCIETGEIFGISFQCNSEIDVKLKLFQFDGEEKTSDSVAFIDSIDSLDKIKKLKELLDIGAITAEEFEQKKQQLLNL